ncbi:hypothetical protein GA0070624_3201 [Micromonospora rhizosphaerae]|uniref:Bacterial transcriptional activator domain-containing protein n=1 Tax=Micromonospora rhizosphaerae TaxID=568872 RepID=A0A1C6S9F9_9ACTN|nr:hypothetical protein [Micromonospora rhizosphaerae]SCL25912.1 hypothetical protein GA0070624_3201 [Micromonospora rhizosphaerae]
MIVSLEPELLELLTRLDDPQATAVAEELDDNLAAAVRRAAFMRRLFYAAVLIVALYGTATGAVAAFDLPWWIAIGGIFALELGGVTFLSNADVRRRLGEHAAASRLLGGIIAAAAATFNVVTHANRLLGGFYALMSVLGFVSWWVDVENKRRDRLRARGLLPAPTPRYELWGHWIRHPMITAQARGFAKAYPQLGLYGSLQAALIVRRRERRDAALADVLRARIRAAAGKKMADIAVLTYDMDEVARRLRANADYEGLTALLGSELTAEHVLHGRDDEAAVAARAFLARQAQTRLPLTGTGAGPDEPAPSADHAEIAETDNPSPHSVPDRHTMAPDEASWRAPFTVEDRLPAEGTAVNGQAVLPPAGARPGVLPARPTTAGGITVTLAEPDDSRDPDQVDAPPPDPPASTTTRSSGGSGPPSGGPVRITVIGEPAVLDATGQPIRGLRAKSMELLVFLVVRRNGAPLTEILHTVWPDVTMQKANQRLSTCLSNLRGIIRGALEAIDPADRDETADGPRPEPIVNTGGHYHLDPAIVTVDWWQLLDERRACTPSATDAVVSAARARIADGYDYPWLDIDPDGPPADRHDPQPWEGR